VVAPDSGRQRIVTDERCLFCRIIAGDEPASVVWADGAVTVFLDTRPLFPGHSLVVPNRHVVTLADLDPTEVGPLFSVVQRLSEAVPSAMGALGSFVANNNTVSQSVPHLHVHVVPRRPKDGLRGFFWPRTRYDSDQEAAEVARRIAEVYRRLT